MPARPRAWRPTTRSATRRTRACRCAERARPCSVRLGRLAFRRLGARLALLAACGFLGRALGIDTLALCQPLQELFRRLERDAPEVAGAKLVHDDFRGLLQVDAALAQQRAALAADDVEQFLVLHGGDG